MIRTLYGASISTALSAILLIYQPFDKLHVKNLLVTQHTTSKTMHDATIEPLLQSLPQIKWQTQVKLYFLK